MELPSLLLRPSLKKNFKNPPRKYFLYFREWHFLAPRSKKFLIFQEMELFSSNIEKFLIFSQKEALLIFGEMKLSYISGNGTFLYFGKRKPRKNSLYSRKRKFLIFQEELPKPQKPKFLTFLQK